PWAPARRTARSAPTAAPRLRPTAASAGVVARACPPPRPDARFTTRVRDEAPRRAARGFALLRPAAAKRAAALTRPGPLGMMASGIHFAPNQSDSATRRRWMRRAYPSLAALGLLLASVGAQPAFAE